MKTTGTLDALAESRRRKEAVARQTGGRSGDIQRDALSARNQLMQVLAMIRADNEARIQIQINEHVIENNHVRKRPIPYPILKYRCRRGAARA